MKAAVLGLCLFAAGVAMLGSGVGALVTSHRAKAWPTTQGTIASSTCVDYSDWDNGRRFFAQVTYRYAVAGTEYQGDRIAFGYSGGWWRTPNQHLADWLAPATSVLVRYDPHVPSVAVLAVGVNGAMARTLFIGMWLLLVAAAVSRHRARSPRTTDMLSLSWGTTGARIMTQGVGGIALMVLAGWGLALVLSFVIDWGIRV